MQATLPSGIHLHACTHCMESKKVQKYSAAVRYFPSSGLTWSPIRGTILVHTYSSQSCLASRHLDAKSACDLPWSAWDAVPSLRLVLQVRQLQSGSAPLDA